MVLFFLNLEEQELQELHVPYRCLVLVGFVLTVGKKGLENFVVPVNAMIDGYSSNNAKSTARAAVP